MSDKREPYVLKVCSTCGFWSSQYKGFCLRHEQGVGRFCMCLEWSAAAAEDHLPKAPPAAQARA